MSTRWTLADVNALQNKTRAIKAGSRYNNKRTQVDGWWFDSQLEADRYKELKLLRAASTVSLFLCQVPFRLPGGITYRADFAVMWMDSCGWIDHVGFEDCKGVMTRVSQNKIKQVEEIYGIKISILTRDQVARST